MRNDVLGLFANITDEFCDDLAMKLKGKKVLEIFGGNGFLAKELSDRGVEIKSTSILSSMDGHEYKLYFDVENIEATKAVLKYGKEYDVLLMAFPVADTSAVKAVAIWGEKKDVIYIGERTESHPQCHGFFAGCASDSLHKSLVSSEVLESYTPKNMIDTAIIGRFDRRKLDEFLDSTNGSHYWLSC